MPGADPSPLPPDQAPGQAPDQGDVRRRVVAVIPARGGSKGIPRKNLARVGGRTLVRRAAEACRAAAGVDLVVVSTDDDEIAAEARAAGAHVVRRPDDLSGDTATSESAVAHALDVLAAPDTAADSPATDPEVVLLVQATSPFLWPDDVDALVAAVDAGADGAFTVTASHGFLWRRGPAGVEGVNHGVVPRQRRQDLDAQFLETGAAYAMRVDGFRRSGHRFFGTIEMIEMPHERSMEIDEPADLDLARDIAPRLDRRWLASRLPDPPAAIVFDFDGVLTDDRVTTDQDGHEMVTASRGDGMGVGLLRAAGVPMVVISKERNPVTAARCAKLGLEVQHGVDDKVAVLRGWLADHDLDPARVVYVGNDVNDVACMELVGCPVAVADAHPAALAAATVVLSRPGGHGAVRELADALLD
ncbi:MAG: acylneuraminate cytidylyltransferase [Ilumatobacteraceae bacterium]